MSSRAFLSVRQNAWRSESVIYESFLIFRCFQIATGSVRDGTLAIAQLGLEREKDPRFPRKPRLQKKVASDMIIQRHKKTQKVLGQATQYHLL